MCGHQIASGLNPQSPYPDGSITLQKPVFAKSGLDLSGMHNGTLNIDISPFTFAITRADHVVEKVEWLKGFPAETFSFIRCGLTFSGKTFPGWVYFPHPETKPRDFQPASVVEVLAPLIADIDYGDTVTLHVSKTAITLTQEN